MPFRNPRRSAPRRRSTPSRPKPASGVVWISLAYVGLTRAKARLFLSCAVQRRLAGYAGAREPSRFLLEMPPDAIVPVGGRREPVGPAAPPPWAGRVMEPASDPGPDPADEYPFRVGARVRHAGWGDGVLTGIQKDGGDVVVTYMIDHGMVIGDILHGLVITHAHEDHYGGVPTVVSTFTVERYVDSGFTADSPGFIGARNAAESDVRSVSGKISVPAVPELVPQLYSKTSFFGEYDTSRFFVCW